MKTILNPRKNHYLKRVSFLLIAVALVAAMVSCDGEPTPTRYNLTMAVDPPGYGTAVDVTGAGAYEAGAVVDIQATANPGNQFVVWSTTGGTLGDANAATTTLTMPAQNVTVTAHFVGPLDHFSGYYVEGEVPPLEKDVGLEDQFIAINTTVMEPRYFFNPVEKLHDTELTPISNDNHHYMFYSLDYPEEEWGTWFVEVNNQFGTQHLTVVGPVGLGVPTQKLEPGHHEPPLGLDHLLVYEVYYDTEPPIMDEEVTLLDQFVDDLTVPVLYPVLFANPVQKTHGTEVTEIFREPQDHMLFYFIGEGVNSTQVQVNNQFGDDQTFDVIGPDLLGVPSDKVNFTKQLDHFKGYGLGESSAINEDVILKDQFVDDFQATVKWAYHFCNPAEKQIIEGPPPIPISYPENHLTLYTIQYEGEYRYWYVELDNQFGYQELYVEGPVRLAVPTTKEGHGDPVGLNHFLLYQVVGEPLPLEAPVILHDQFAPEGEGALVLVPEFFANPVHKTHGTAESPIVDPWNHLLFYEIVGTEVESDVQFDNQFGDAVTNHCYPADLLGVPSLKLFAEEVFP